MDCQEGERKGCVGEGKKEGRKEERRTHHSGHTPHIGTCAPFGAENNFWRPVLSRLDVVCEMMAHPACIAQIRNLDTNGVHRRSDVFLHFRFRTAGFVEGYAANVFGYVIAVAGD